MINGMTINDAIDTADALEMLAGVDEGEHTDYDNLMRISGQLREMVATFADYRLWVSEDRCSRMEIWRDGSVIVAWREQAGDVWGPPISLREEKVPA
jgi:hypothetical protein